MAMFKPIFQVMPFRISLDRN